MKEALSKPPDAPIGEESREKIEKKETRENAEGKTDAYFEHVPYKIERRIGVVVGEYEKTERMFRAVETATKNAEKEKALEAAREKIMGRDSARLKSVEKKHAQYEQELQEEALRLKTQLDSLQEEKNTWERLYAEGPADAREALAVKRVMEGSDAPHSFWGKLQDEAIILFQGKRLQERVHDKLSYENGSRRSQRMQDFDASLFKTQQQINELEDPERFRGELQDSAEKSARFFQEGVAKQFPEFDFLFNTDGEQFQEVLKKYIRSFDDRHLPDAIQKVGNLVAYYDVMRVRTELEVERTRYGFLSEKSGKQISVPSRMPDQHIRALETALQAEVGGRLVRKVRAVNTLDDCDVRFLSDKVIDTIQSLAVRVEGFTGNDQVSWTGERDNNLIEKREGAREEAERLRNEVIFHVSPPDKFFQAIEDKLYSLTALKKINPEITEGTSGVGKNASHSHHDQIFFSGDEIQGGYGREGETDDSVWSGGKKGDFGAYRISSHSLTGFATVEGFLMKEALSTHDVGGGGREIGFVQMDKSEAVLDPAETLVAFVPQRLAKKAQQAISQAFEKGKERVPALIVYPDELLKEGDGIDSSKRVSEFVRGKIHQLQKEKGWFQVGPGGVRKTPEGYTYYEEDSIQW